MQNISLAERLSRELVEYIRSHQLTPGDVLPSARALAQQYGTTLPTVREALRMLEATEIVALRHGSGTYVGPGVDKPFLVNPYAEEGTLESALELTEARLVVEPEIAAVAAQRRDGAAIARLEGTLCNALEADMPRSGSHFHLALAQATGQPILSEMLETMLALRQHDRAVIRSIYANRPRDHAEHAAILQAVREGDPTAARALTAAHLTHIRTELRDAIREAGS
ncbi:FadR/GntR family transcriptional regulator [Micrococcus luteus]|uniref:FadR/GntR family transcriptional regulator n=1 Tax=Micrococcus luteus TaxID=1270 RepID=UPI0015D9124E|nr:GntR family transcriptional regulator [Micrococcus luteus]